MPSRSRKYSDIIRYAGGIRRDTVDLRDLEYRPTLKLLPERYLSAALDPRRQIKGAPILKVRNQRRRTTCVGEALAAVIDIQRIERATHRGAFRSRDCVSAGMLHAMALSVQREEEVGRSYGVSEQRDLFSIRVGLKGFFNAGACTEQSWEDRGLGGRGSVNLAFDDADVDVMKAARKITLGAYYRVRHVINHYHTAILEAGALYVSAEIHHGWSNTQEREGCISPLLQGAGSGGHAFAIVGYNDKGFLVLNSWGKAWGHYEFVDENGEKIVLPGVALWSYEDWATSIYDAWVLRLGVPTPGAFQFAIGEQGLTASAPTIGAAPSTNRARQLDMVGRYVHLDDGHHVEKGSYPSSQKSFETTRAYLENGKGLEYSDIVAVLHGDLTDTSEVLSRAAKSLNADQKARVYRVSFAWVNDLLYGAGRALQPLFDHAVKLTNGPSEDCDALIVKLTRPVGRALWRDVKRSARVAAMGESSSTRVHGAAAQALIGLARLGVAQHRRFHLVVEAVGVQLLCAFLENAREADKKLLLRSLRTVSLVAPVIDERDFKLLATWLRPRARERRDVTLYRPSENFRRRLRVGSYSKSWSSLIGRAFEEAGDPLLSEITENGSGRQMMKVVHIEADATGGPLDLLDCIENAVVKKHVFKRIVASRRSARKV